MFCIQSYNKVSPIIYPLQNDILAAAAEIENLSVIIADHSNNWKSIHTATFYRR